MKKAIPIVLAAVLCGMAAPAAAQANLNEVSVFGSWDDVDEPEEAEVFNLQVRYGRFVSPRLVATASLTRSSFESRGADSASTTFLIGAKYYFNEPRAQVLVPFVDGGVGFTNIDTGGNDSTDLSWEVGGGASLFMTERTSFDGALRLYNTETDARTRGIRLFVGITTRF